MDRGATNAPAAQNRGHNVTDCAAPARPAWTPRCPCVPLFETAYALAQQRREPSAAVLYRTGLERKRSAHNHLVPFSLGALPFTLNARGSRRGPLRLEGAGASDRSATSRWHEPPTTRLSASALPAA